MNFYEFKIHEIQDCGSYSNHDLFLGFCLGFQITGLNTVPSPPDFSPDEVKADMGKFTQDLWVNFLSEYVSFSSLSKIILCGSDYSIFLIFNIFFQD